MIDRHTYRDHRYEAARSTGDRYAPERGYDFSYVPGEPKAPKSVKIVMAVILVVTAVAFVTPIILREIL